VHHEQALKEPETLRNVVSVLVFEPIIDGIESIDDAPISLVSLTAKHQIGQRQGPGTATWLMFSILFQVMDRSKP